MSSRTTPALAVMAMAWIAAAPASAQKSRTPIADALEELGTDVRVYNDHLVTLANPFMEGRRPGTRGMEIAKEYCEFWLKKYGLQPAFPTEAGPKSYRQPFPISRRTVVKEQSLGTARTAFRAGSDFNALGYGNTGEVSAPIVFVGYGVENGPNGYASYADDADFTDKIVVLLRWEPMDANGKSKWATGRTPWSAWHNTRRKLRAISRRGAEAMIIVDTPGAADPRSGQLMAAGSGRRRTARPVFMMTSAAADKLIRELDGTQTLDALTEQANEGTTVVDFPGKVTVSAKLAQEPFMAENVGALLPGRGALKDELVVIGAHLDHLGMGNFGSRDFKNRGKKLHPGADDNASGSAGVLMIAEKIAEDFRNLEPSKPARSVLFILFSAEESGLIGSQYYVKKPIVPLDKHALMINFDMIGRITKKQLAVSNTKTAKGMHEWLQPFFEKSPLVIKHPKGMGGGSDHMPFDMRGVPNLFAIITPFHNDYHTSRDVSWKINRVDAVHAVNLFHQIGFAAATRTEPFVPTKRRRGSRKGN